MNMESNINRNILKVRYTVRLKSRSFRKGAVLSFWWTVAWFMMNHEG